MILVFTTLRKMFPGPGAGGGGGGVIMLVKAKILRVGQDRVSCPFRLEGVMDW